MYIHDYFDSLQRGIWKNRKIGFLERPVLCKAFDDHHGLFKGSVFFWDSSRLTIEEVISTTQGFPEVLRYSYTYTKGDQHIFRYDNAPHHPDLSTFPEHKHHGPSETAMPAEKPSLAKVFVEIETLLTAK